MMIEDKLKPRNASELWKQIPDVMPMDPKDILRPVRAGELWKTEGFDHTTVMKIVDLDRLMSVPKFNWDSIFTFFQNQ